MAPRTTFASMLAILAAGISLHVAASTCTGGKSSCDWSAAASKCNNGAFCGLSDCSTPCVSNCSNSNCDECRDAVGACADIYASGTTTDASLADYTLKVIFSGCQGAQVCVPFDGTDNYQCGACSSGSTSTTIKLPASGPCVTQSTCDWSLAGQGCTNNLFCANSDCSTPCYMEDCNGDCSTCLASSPACTTYSDTGVTLNSLFGANCTGPGCVDFVSTTATCGKCTSSSSTTVTSESPKRCRVKDMIIVYLVLAAVCLLSLSLSEDSFLMKFAQTVATRDYIQSMHSCDLSSTMTCA